MNSTKYKKIGLILADILIVAVSGLISNYILNFFGVYSNAFSKDGMSTEEFAFFVTLNVAFCFFSQYVFGAYSRKWGNLVKKDYLSCVVGISLGMLLTSLIMIISGQKLEFIFVFVNYLLIATGVVMFRYIAGNIYASLYDYNRNEFLERTLIIGAGLACKMIIQDIDNAKMDPDNPFKTVYPVCIVDDDVKKLKQYIKGVPVKGTTGDIVSICKQYDISLIIFAIPSASIEDRKRILDICAHTRVKIKIVPYLGQILVDGEDVHLLKQVKDIKLEDLLGRAPVSFDKEDLRHFIKGKVCMVTGGGGSIGAELVRQIAKYNPKTVIIVDIYENNAYDIQQELIMEYGQGLNLITLIASVRDYEKMKLIFEKYRPELVFHAAAHKHVPLMETSPEEAVKNNVLGTYNVAHLSGEYGVEKFIMISTDKAVNPTNVMGATKRCCEMIIQDLAVSKPFKTEYITTRFGNVLGSNGSVIPLFKRQIENNRPVTVTHPEVMRYFMTIPEAVSLVLQAAAMANGGEIFVLDMGAPVKIVTLAENLITMYGKRPYIDVEIKFTGLRPGEKLYEELLTDEEGLTETSNNKIYIGRQITFDSEEFNGDLNKLMRAASKNDSEKARKILKKLVPTFVQRDIK